LKAFCLAFAFALAAVPVSADELPQTSNAWRAIEPGLADPGTFHWTVEDIPAGEAQAPAAVSGLDARDKQAPARAALAEIRAETARVFSEAQQASATVERIRYDLRVSCVVEQISYEPDPLDSVSLPWLWDSINEEERTVRGTVEMCQVDYSQKVRTQASAEAQVKTMPRPQMQSYQVSFPIGD
jgi:hypothetical protein